MKLRRVLVRLLAVTAAAVVAVPVVAPVAADAAVSGPVVTAYGTAPKFRGPAGPLNQAVVAIAGDPAHSGFWSLTADGGVFTSGNAAFFGAPAGQAMPGSAADMAGTATGRGYWIVTTQGGVYHYGDARWRGSARGETTRAIVGIAGTPSGLGYWLAAADGEVFAFGDADHLGQAVNPFVPSHIVDIASTATGNGYALLDANGTVFSYGDALDVVKPARVAKPAVALEIGPRDDGYWILGANGSVTRYNTSLHVGDASGLRMQAIDLASTPGGGGYWIASTSPFPALPGNSGAGRRVVYSNSQQRIWLVESNGIVSNSYLVSGRRGAPPPGTYAIASKSPMSSAGSLRLPYMSRFYRASSGKWIGFHGIPLRPDGTPIQTDAQLGTPLSHGCVRMNQQSVKVVYDWTPVGTTVVVLP